VGIVSLRVVPSGSRAEVNREERVEEVSGVPRGPDRRHKVETTLGQKGRRRQCSGQQGSY